MLERMGRSMSVCAVCDIPIKGSICTNPECGLVKLHKDLGEPIKLPIGNRESTEAVEAYLNVRLHPDDREQLDIIERKIDELLSKY